MKKVLALVLTIAMATLALVGCGFDPSVKSEGVMTYEEYMAAELDDEVTIEAFVQAKQVWNSEYQNTTFYMQDTVGGYFVYRLACTEAEYNTIKVGSRLKITGYKTEWAGEVEIADAEFEVLEGTYNASYTDLTHLLDSKADNDGGKELVDYQNMKAYFTGMEIVAANEDGDAFLYGWDGSGADGGDIYFNAKVDGKTYTFVIETDLVGNNTDVYAAAKALKVGDKVDMAGFLYWYEGPQPQITNITVVDAAD